HAQISGDERGDLVFESLLLPIGERKVVGIRANPERGGDVLGHPLSECQCCDEEGKTKGRWTRQPVPDAVHEVSLRPPRLKSLSPVPERRAARSPAPDKARRRLSPPRPQRLASFSGRPNTVSTPPWVLNLSASPNAPSAPRPAVGSSGPIPAATPMPAQPPTPERTATYWRPLGPR